MVSYPVAVGSKAVKKDDLRLFVKGTKTPLVFQLSDVEEKDGLLKKAVIHFSHRSQNRPREKAFTLVQLSADSAGAGRADRIQ